MFTFSFGRKKKRSTKRKASKKPSAYLRKMCKKYRIKVTRKVGKRRVYKKVSVLKKQLRKKMKKGHKRVQRRRSRLSRFGGLFSSSTSKKFGKSEGVDQKEFNRKYNTIIDKRDILDNKLTDVAEAVLPRNGLDEIINLRRVKTKDINKYIPPIYNAGQELHKALIECKTFNKGQECIEYTRDPEYRYYTGNYKTNDFLNDPSYNNIGLFGRKKG
jgi:hypothetical protein